jgi:prepilin peptidase CpaA
MVIDFMDTNAVRTTAMVVATTIAVVTDVRERRIPNVLTGTVVVAGLCIGALSSGMSGFLFAAGGMLTGALLFLVLVAKMGWGMGDLKLVAALGAVGGPIFVLWMGLYAMVAGGVFTLLWLGSRGQLSPVTAGIGRDLRARRAPSADSGLAIPFAIPIAAGVVAALLVSPGLP